MNVSPIRIISSASSVTLLEFSEDGSQLLSGSENGTLSIWSTRSWREESVYDLSSTIQWIVELPSSTHTYLIQTRDGAFFLHSAPQKGAQLIPTESSNHLGFCKAHYSDRLLASPLNEADILVRSYDGSTREFQSIQTLFSCESGTITALKLISLEKQLIATYEVGKMVLWDILKQEQVHCINILSSAWGFDWDPLLSTGLISGPHKEIVSFTIDDDKKFKILKSRALPTEGISEIKIRHQSKAKIVCASSWDGTIRIFSWLFPEKIKSLGALKFHTESVNCLAISKVPIKMKGREKYVLAGGSKDERISLWDIYNDDIKV